MPEQMVFKVQEVTCSMCDENAPVSISTPMGVIYLCKKHAEHCAEQLMKVTSKESTNLDTNEQRNQA